MFLAYQLNEIPKLSRCIEIEDYCEYFLENQMCLYITVTYFPYLCNNFVVNLIYDEETNYLYE